MKRLTIAVLTLVLWGGAALANDHITNAVGQGNRDFANPQTQNPSGVSGGRARGTLSPGEVPGGGDPKTGNRQGTPSGRN